MQEVDWVAVDLDFLERSVAFRRDWKQLRKRRWLQEHRSSHSVQAFDDGILVMQRGGVRNEALEQAGQALLRPLPRIQEAPL